MNSAVDTSHVPGRFETGGTRRTGLRREIGFIGRFEVRSAWALRSALPADKIEELAGPGYVMPAYQSPNTSPNAPSAGTSTVR